MEQNDLHTSTYFSIQLDWVSRAKPTHMTGYCYFSYSDIFDEANISSCFETVKVCVINFKEC